MATLAERLGHAPDAKLLIVNCDDLGSTHSANVAVYDALRHGVATSASPSWMSWGGGKKGSTCQVASWSAFGCTPSTIAS